MSLKGGRRVVLKLPYYAPEGAEELACLRGKKRSSSSANRGVRVAHYWKKKRNVRLAKK